MQGHWLLAKIGKRVLRPGGEKLTRRMLEQVPARNGDIVEFAPGLGRTTRLILDRSPASYRGVDKDPAIAAIITRLVAPVGGVCIEADAADSTLQSDSADAVIGEAMLSMQGERGKRAIVHEAFRLLRPGGTYALHELGLQPDNLPQVTKDRILKDLAHAIHVNARPLTAEEWRELLESEGFEVSWSGTEPMALLRMRRNLADEGLSGVIRITANVLSDKEIRKRVLTMRSTFNKYAKELTGIAFVVRKPAAADATND